MKTLQFFIIVASAIVFWGPSVTLASEYHVEEFTVCTISGWEDYAAISGNIIVWEDYRNGNWDIYGYDLDTDTEFAVCTASKEQAYPAISGNIIVWRDTRNGNLDIYGYDLDTDTEFAVCTNSANQDNPVVSGNIIVWEDWRNANMDKYDADIYGYDLDTDTEFAVCTGSSYQYYPAISGNIIVWEDNRNGNWDIYGYDLDTNTEFAVCTDAEYQYYPAVSGNIIVWEDYRNGGNEDYNWDIYGYDLDTDTEFAVCTAVEQQGSVAVSDNIIVWGDYRNGNWDIYGYDLNTDTEFAVCTDSSEQAYPAVSGNTIVWDDNREGKSDIYSADLVCDTPLTVTGQPAVNIEGTSATLRGIIIDDGCQPCEYRFVYREQGEPGTVVFTSWTGSVSTGQSFSEDISGLSPGTVYEFWAEAKNSAGYAIAEDPESFTTQVISPMVVTQSAINVEGTTATLKGTVENDGGEACEYRFVYEIEGEPGTLVYTSWTCCVNTGESFSQDISGLSPGIVYDVWAQVKNSADYFTGETESFTTKVLRPIVTTKAATNVEGTSATLWGETNDDGGEACEYRFVYEIEGEPSTLVYTSWTCCVNTGESFSQDISGLSPGTVYDVWAQAKNSADYFTGESESFTTKVLRPIVTTKAATNVEGTTAILKGTVENDGGEACEYRFVYEIEGEPGTLVFTSWTCCVNTGESFSQDISGLSHSTVYEFWAEAKNSTGYAIAEDPESFTTK